MPRISDDILLTHLEVALAVAPEHTLVRLNADDPRAQRSARVDLARHLVEACAASPSKATAMAVQARSRACFRAICRRSDELVVLSRRVTVVAGPGRWSSADTRSAIACHVRMARLVASKCERPNLLGDVQGSLFASVNVV
jgi:hypothetical protein